MYNPGLSLIFELESLIFSSLHKKLDDVVSWQNKVVFKSKTVYLNVNMQNLFDDNINKFYFHQKLSNAN